MFTLIETPTAKADADRFYFNRLTNGEIWLLLVYPKSEKDTIPGHLVKAIRGEIEND